MLPSVILLSFVYVCEAFHDNIRLPKEHIPYFYHNNPQAKEACIEQEEHCPYKDILSEEKCWGYEENCALKKRMLNPRCPEDVRWMKNKNEQIERFWLEADYGYIKQKRHELTSYCTPETERDSSLQCVDHTRYCKATNLYMDLSTYDFHKERNRYSEAVFMAGQLGGHCKFYKSKLDAQGDHKSPLQSWFGELQHYRALDFKPMSSGKCDITFEKPTILMKLDAGVNMYHHFCDYINLYATQHLSNEFSLDVQIIMWDTSYMKYGDFFSDTWKAFSYHPIIPLYDLRGKKLCFKEAIFPLLARMRYGLYYNMPLTPGCHSSSLFRAFSQQTLHRLNITQGPHTQKIRITLLERNTQYRNIMNQPELVTALTSRDDYVVNVVDYRKIPFLDQLQVTYNSDIFIGMHGAGLTHLLFQPDWGVIFELYNCEDVNCYKDLARLRGVKYITWHEKKDLIQEDEGHHPTLGAHAKFTNYGFGVEEFMRRIDEAADYVTNQPAYVQRMHPHYHLINTNAHVEL